MRFDTYLATIQQIYASYDSEPVLFPPATPQELAMLEAALGFPIAPELRAAWSIANGSETWTPLFVRPGYLTGLDFLSVAQALEERESMRRCAPQYRGYSDPRPRDERIRAGWFHDGWLPFAAFGGATILLIQDYAPSAAGAVGQIIAFTHDPDEMTYVAPDFGTLLQRCHDDIVANPDEFVPEVD